MYVCKNIVEEMFPEKKSSQNALSMFSLEKEKLYKTWVEQILEAVFFLIETCLKFSFIVKFKSFILFTIFNIN